ncbi:potassium channel family protein [Azorhizobium doebereinerae]|uniref:potassium channel family protein n=1 Tax=Azorhizobium doebereinerae TaxID=281091 RepID=UPI000405E064|nr:potassium channel family protein [Azorhizobium doebereinerae]
MQLELLYGIIISLVNVVIQSIASVLLVRAMLALGKRVRIRHPMRGLLLGMALTGAILTFAHLLEVGVWALSYISVDGVTNDKDAYYLAFVNFTTLGYGDLLPAPRWRLLGPVTAANGMLLFGWSTALIFAVLTRLSEALGVHHVSVRHRSTPHAGGHHAQDPQDTAHAGTEHHSSAPHPAGHRAADRHPPEKL